jgi:Ca2+-transporting ATPase
MEDGIPTNSSNALGLSTAEATRRLAKFGPNSIAKGREIAPITIFLRQFRSLLIAILFVAAALAAALGETIDAIAILTIVVVNGVLGFVQEWRAERAIDALRDMLAPSAEVLRDGRPQMVPAADLVPGDLVFLSEGQKVPADIALRVSAGLRLDESALSGESVPVDRSAHDEDTTVFMGTLIVGGRGEGSVVATGSRTRFGEIAELTRSAGEKTTRLQAQLSDLSRRLGLWGLMVAAAVFVLGLRRTRGGGHAADLGLAGRCRGARGPAAGRHPDAGDRGLGHGEAEGAAAALAGGRNAWLGHGDLHRQDGHADGKQDDGDAHRRGGRSYDASGTGYDPAGRIVADGRRVLAEHDPLLARLLHAALVCNNARLERHADWEMIGDPTEGALITLAYKGWIPLPDPGARLAETPFSSERKRMATLAKRPDGGIALFVKGAPESVLPACVAVLHNGEAAALDATRRETLTAQYEAMAREGLRVIAIADRDATGAADLEERDLVLLGFVGLLDPPRPEIADAVRLCQSAGVRILMITGDSATTAPRHRRAGWHHPHGRDHRRGPRCDDRCRAVAGAGRQHPLRPHHPGPQDAHRGAPAGRGRDRRDDR